MTVDRKLLTEFIKITNDNDNGDDKTKNTVQTTMYGTIVRLGDINYVKMDGSDILTPFKSTIEVKPDDRVIFEIQSHRVVVTGNLTDPSSSGTRVDEVEDNVEIITKKVIDSEGRIAEVEIRADQISSRVTGLDGKYTEIKQTVDSIDITGMVTFNDLKNANSKTVIDGANIKTGTLTATGEIGFADGARITPFASHIPGKYGLQISAPAARIEAGLWSITSDGRATFDGSKFTLMDNMFYNSGIGYTSGFILNSAGTGSVATDFWANSYRSRYSAYSEYDVYSLQRINEINPWDILDSVDTMYTTDGLKIRIPDSRSTYGIKMNPLLCCGPNEEVGWDMESTIATLIDAVKELKEENNLLKEQLGELLNEQ